MFVILIVIVVVVLGVRLEPMRSCSLLMRAIVRTAIAVIGLAVHLLLMVVHRRWWRIAAHRVVVSVWIHRLRSPGFCRKCCPDGVQ